MKERNEVRNDNKKLVGYYFLIRPVVIKVNWIWLNTPLSLVEAVSEIREALLPRSYSLNEMHCVSVK